MMHLYVPADNVAVVVGKDIRGRVENRDFCRHPVLLHAFRQADEIYGVPAFPTLLLTCIQVL